MLTSSLQKNVNQAEVAQLQTEDKKWMKTVSENKSNRNTMAIHSKLSQLEKLIMTQVDMMARLEDQVKQLSTRLEKVESKLATTGK